MYIHLITHLPKHFSILKSKRFFAVFWYHKVEIQWENEE